MRNLVIYYSWMGNTEIVAKEIHQVVGGDLIKIEEEKQRKTGGFGGAAASAFLGFKSKLKPINFSLKDYDNIFIGAQVWAARSTPAINAFLSQAELENKKVYLFITKADDKVPKKVIDSISERVEKRGGVVIDSFSVTTRMKTTITAEAIKAPISQWITKVGLK
jgi:flavodoxin